LVEGGGGGEGFRYATVPWIVSETAAENKKIIAVINSSVKKINNTSKIRYLPCCTTTVYKLFFCTSVFFLNVFWIEFVRMGLVLAATASDRRKLTSKEATALIQSGPEQK
jgi:hypothetical protein